MTKSVFAFYVYRFVCNWTITCWIVHPNIEIHELNEFIQPNVVQNRNVILSSVGDISEMAQ